MIQKLPIEENSETVDLMFRWQGMSIYMGLTLAKDGAKYLLMQVEDVGTVGACVYGTTAKWTTYNPDGERIDASVFTISNGSADPATSKSMGER